MSAAARALHMDIEVVGDYRAAWGEGPIWWNGALYYVDIEGHRVICTSEEGDETSWEVGQRVGTVVPRVGGGLAIAGDEGFLFLNLETGELTPKGDPESDKPDNRFNDGKCSPDGRFFAGTISLVKKTGDASLYRLDADGTITRVYSGVTNSNGIVWTADGGRMFYIDSPRRAVLTFRYAPDTGSMTEEEVAFSTEEIPGSPDGMALDVDGNLWIAFCHGSCVVCFDQSGRRLRRIDFPCREVTAVAFGGPTLEDLYVTSGIPKENVEELAGRLFRVRGVGARGLKAQGFAG